MTSLKRKAENELTSSSVAVLQPIVNSNNMNTISGAISQVWSWCRNLYIWFSIPKPTSTYATMSYSNSDIVADTHIQTSKARADGTTSLKRQKTRPRASRSKSVVDQSRKGGGVRLDYTGCVTNEDKRQRNENFWAPPDFGSFRSTKHEPPLTPESLSGDEQDNKISHLYRRRSDSFLSPMTPESMTNTNRSHAHQHDRSHRTTMSSSSRSFGASRSDVQASETGTKSLEERMNLLLVSPEDDKGILPPSKYIVEKRTRLARERKIKERQAAARAAKELRLSRRWPKKPLVHQLDSKWIDTVEQIKATTSHHHVLATSIGGTELRIKDFRTLLGRSAWLNDEIVNTYLEWIVEAANKAAAEGSRSRGEEVSSVPKFIAHNSFFYNNLSTKGASSTERLMKRKKAPGTSLMEVDSVFVPICKNNHWTVGVVRPVAKTIEYFDSFGGSSTIFTNLMRNWLKFQLGDAYVEGDWKVPNTGCARQTNGWDCGVFVCTNSFCVASGLDTSCYRERDMVQQRENIAAVLINRGFTGDFAWGEEGF